MSCAPVRTGQSSRRTRAPWKGMVALLWSILAIAQVGCVRDERIATPGDTTPPEVVLREPATGDVVADTLRVWAEVTDDQGVARVALLIDNLPRAIRHEPPWRFAWPCSAVADSAQHRVVLEASDAAGNFASTPPQEVTICPNRAPRAWIDFPWDGLWIEAGSQAAVRPWRATAVDPEDGRLGAASLVWSLDQSVLPFGGVEISPPPLAPGSSEVKLTAKDRWGRRATATHLVHLFTYPVAGAPREAGEAFFSAWRARDASVAVSLCAQDMRLVPPESGGERAGWTQSRFAEALSCWLGDSTLVRLDVIASNPTIEELTWGETRWAKLEFMSLRIEAETVRVHQADRPPQTEAVRIRTAVRMFLREDRETGLWRIVTWWDLHESPWISAEGPSLSVVLGRALGTQPD